MLNNHHKKYFTYLIYNPNVEHSLDFTFIEPYSNRDIYIKWEDNINPTAVETYVQDSKQENYVSDPLLFLDDDRLLLSDFTLLKDYTLNQTLINDKNLEQSTSVIRGSVNEKNIDLLDSYKKELDTDRLINPDLNLPFLDNNNLFINRFLKNRIEDPWIKTSIRQTELSTVSNSLEFKRVPTGKTIITVLNNNECIAAFYSPGPKEGYLVSPQLSSNMQETSIYDIALSLILTVALKDYQKLTNLLIGLTNLSENNKDQKGFVDLYDRVTLSPLSSSINIKNNSILLWALCLSLSYIQDVPIANRISLIGQQLDSKLKDVILKLIKCLSLSFDEISGYCFKYLNQFNEVQSKDNIEASFWVSLALAKGLNIVFDERVHETAAKLFLNVDKIKDLNNGPMLNDFNYESWSEVKEARYIWLREFGEEIKSVESFSDTEYLGNLIYKNEYTDILKETISNKDLNDRTFREEVFLTLTSISSFNFINQKVFDLLARETEAYIAYLENWSKYTWPSGQKWNNNNEVHSIGSVLHSVLSSNSYAAFSSSLKIKRLEQAIRLKAATGDLLNGYSTLFNCRQLESDSYWRTFLSDLSFMTNNHLNKVNEDYFKFFGLVAVKDKKIVREWVDKKSFDWFSSPEQENYITKTFDPLNPKEEDYYYLAYYPKQRFLNSETKLGNVPILKIDYIKRPVPGFSQFLDCSQDIFIDDDFDITSDSNYYIDPMRKYVGQIWIDTLSSTECLNKIITLNLISGVRANIIYNSIYNVVD